MKNFECGNKRKEVKKREVCYFSSAAITKSHKLDCFEQ